MSDAPPPTGVGDTRDPEVRAADEALLDAITNRLRVTGVLREDEVVDEFIVAASIDGMGLRERAATRYGYLTRDSGYGPHGAPLHHLEGLLRRAIRWLDEDDHEAPDA